ncbi:hypothetical protein JX266_008941 [Neoarthrinium moseri]|nr:hypothetical protein JX266_008941 [Neoarthrinium moseri]
MASSGDIPLGNTKLSRAECRAAVQSLLKGSPTTNGSHGVDAEHGKRLDLLNVILHRHTQFVYMAEGRANVVFKLIEPEIGVGEEYEGQHVLAGLLLRVPKIVKGTEPHSYEELQRYRERLVEPKVGAQHLVPQLLVKLEPRITQQMNLERDRNSQRDTASTLAEGHAMLIEDMSTPPWRNAIGLEFKPKWLAQSPIAPADATRCRTCAREGFRNSEKRVEGKKTSPPVCPLGLVHGNPAVVLETIRHLTPGWAEADRKRLEQAFQKTQIFQKLRTLQVRGDPGDTMFTNPQDEDFGLAMTLRDCTCFVRMPKDAGGPGETEIRLADVDRKNWESKAEYWQNSHTNLVEKGFYHGREEPRMETHCLLLKPE